jgi:isoaspartyl peptidase/L-asparaginase-like protein (Ntn-hydrolase superfamily)
MDFVRDQGFELFPPEQFNTEYNELVKQQFEGNSHGPFAPPEHGTVGCVAIDIYGRIAAGTSTGGTPFAPKGRVGDSPFPGCGVWADDDDAGCSCTGYGEMILTQLLAANAARKGVEFGAMKGAQEAIRRFARFPQSLGGVIMIMKKTREYGLCHNTDHMPFALLNSDGTVLAGLSFDEKKNCVL